MQDGQLQVQNLGTCWRRQALAQILDQRGGSSPSQVFVEDLDSTVPPIRAHLTRWFLFVEK